LLAFLKNNHTTDFELDFKHLRYDDIATEGQGKLFPIMTEEGTYFIWTM